MGKKLRFAIMIVLLCTVQKALALDLTVVPTNESCTGNGSLSFSVTNATDGVPVFYSVYLLPNTTTPIVTTSSSSHGGLVSGNYLVIASQTINGVENTASQNVSIANTIVPLTFSIIGTNILCGNDGVITVNASSTAVSYQILSGPVTTGVQSSNVFSGLPAGIYNIRVVDTCGDGTVQAFTLLTTTTSLQINPPVFYQVIACNSISVYHTISSGSGVQIAYPLSIQTTVNPPSGAPIVTNQILTSGTLFYLTLPGANNQSYPYNLLITDNCGNTFTYNNNGISYTPILISGPQLDVNASSSCTSLNVVHELTFNANYQFLYPILFKQLFIFQMVQMLLQLKALVQERL